MAIPILTKQLHLLRGFSYWKVKLTTGREFSELDDKIAFMPDHVTGKLVARHRSVEWLEDIIGSGDVARIATLNLVTPQGTVSIDAKEPYTVFQLKRGIMDGFTGRRYMESQIIGHLDDKETGACTAYIWDLKHKKLVSDFHTSVRNFGRWHPDIIPPGALAYEIVGLRLKDPVI